MSYNSNLPERKNRAVNNVLIACRVFIYIFRQQPSEASDEYMSICG
jgi:hypothetical protein